MAASETTAKQTIAARKAIGWVIAAAGTALFIWNMATNDHSDSELLDWNMMYFVISFPIWIVGFGLVILSPRDLRSEALKRVEALEQEVTAADAASMARIKTKAELVQKTLDNEYYNQKMSSTNWIALSERVLAVFAICDGPVSSGVRHPDINGKAYSKYRLIAEGPNKGKYESVPSFFTTRSELRDTIAEAELRDIFDSGFEIHAPDPKSSK